MRDTRCLNGGHEWWECWTRRRTEPHPGVSNTPAPRVHHSGTPCPPFRHPASYKLAKDPARKASHRAAQRNEAKAERDERTLQRLLTRSQPRVTTVPTYSVVKSAW